MDKEKFDPVRKDEMDSHNMGESEFWFSVWIGTLFYYCFYFGQRSFKELGDEKHLKRNVITGWLLYMCVIFGVFFLLYRIFLKE